MPFLLLILLLAQPSAHAELPTEILISGSSFDFLDYRAHSEDRNKSWSLAESFRSHLPSSTSWNLDQTRENLLSAGAILDQPLQSAFYEREGIEFPIKSPDERKRVAERFEAYKKDLGGKLKRHFEKSFLAAGGQVEKLESGYLLYRSPNGIRFYEEFLATPDPELRAAARHFLTSYSRGGSRTGTKADLLVRRLAGSTNGMTQIVDAGALSETDWNRLLKIASNTNFKASRHGPFVLIGSGASFYLTDELLRKNREFQSDLLSRRFDRVLRFLQTANIPIEMVERQGSAASFSSGDSKMNYVVPGDIDSNAFSHELTHGRFAQFRDTLTRWVAKNKFAIPYEIDGPPTPSGYDQYGGFMNLLNEVNSFRIGEAFDGEMSDSAILELIKTYYTRQAGAESIGRFTDVWTPEKIKGKAIPQLIVDSIRALNRLTPKELYELGQKGISGNDEILQMNFLRLLQTRYQNQTPPSELEAIRSRLEKRGTTRTVRNLAASAAPSGTGSSARVAGSNPNARKVTQAQLEQATAPWLESLQRRYEIVPKELKDSTPLFDLARRENIQDFGHLIQRAKKLNYPVHLMDINGAKRLFAELMKRNDKTAAKKIESGLKAYNDRGFDAAWSEYLKDPMDSTYADHILKKYGKPGGPISSRHLQELFGVSMAPEYSTTDGYWGPVNFLDDILEAQGIQELFTDSQYEEEVQRSRRFGRPIPSRRDLTKRPALLNRTLDQFLADHLLDGKPGIHRFGVVNLIQKRFSPDDLPILFGKIKATLINGKSNTNDAYIAGAFLLPENNQSEATKHLWGKRIAEMVMSTPDPSKRGAKFLTEFYRRSVARSLPDYSKVSSSSYVLDENARTEIASSLGKMNPEQRQDYQTAIKHLYRLFQSTDPVVSKGARYAMRAYPAYLLGVEGMIAREMKANPSPELRLKAAQLAAMTDNGFLPRIEAVFSRLKPTPAEKEYLNLMEWRLAARRKCLIDGLVRSQSQP